MVLVLGGMWIGQNINLLPIDASVNAPIYDELFQVLFTIGAILFIGIIELWCSAWCASTATRAARRWHRDRGNLPGNFLDSRSAVVLFVGLYSYDIYDRMGGMVPLAMTTPPR